MTNQYLSLAKQGKNAWWRYLFSLLLILFFYQILGIIPFAILNATLILDGNSATQLNPQTLQFEGIESLLPYLAINFVLISLLAGLYIAVRFVHQRRIITLVTPDKQIKWKRIYQGFGVYFLLISLMALVGFFLAPSEYKFTLKLNQFFIFLPIALIITPIQASAEELFFRGYLMQGLSLITRNSSIAIGGSSVVFMLPHLLNPETASNFILTALLYFCLGLFFAFITVRDNSLELAIGAHTANNLFVVLILNYSNSALPSPSIFTTSELDPFSSLISFVIVAIIFCLIIFRKKGFPKKVE